MHESPLTVVQAGWGQASVTDSRSALLGVGPEGMLLLRLVSSMPGERHLGSSLACVRLLSLSALGEKE